MSKFGIMGYASFNIGDEIQTLAQMRFVPHVDYVVVRERMSKFKSVNNESVKLIMNAYYMHNQKYFPPPPVVEPLPISMHFAPKIINNGFLERKAVSEWLLRNGPIGTRDLYTLDHLKSANIPSYFSGCLTLTLLPNERYRAKQKDKYILAMNLTEPEIAVLKAKTDLPVYILDKKMIGLSFSNRLLLAKCALALYQNAHCVVTRNLHVAFPSLAMGTPVLLLPYYDGKWVDRFLGHYHFCNNITSEEFLSGNISYNFENPPKNPDIYHETAEKLVATVKAFTNYDSNKSPIDDSFDSTFALMTLLQYSEKQVVRNLYYANTAQLEEVLQNKRDKKNNKYLIVNDDKIKTNNIN